MSNIIRQAVSSVHGYVTLGPTIEIELPPLSNGQFGELTIQIWDDRFVPLVKFGNGSFQMLSNETVLLLKWDTEPLLLTSFAGTYDLAYSYRILEAEVGT